jgi:HPt (histidine-containing phosphotransfer) domain-containing protein
MAETVAVIDLATIEALRELDDSAGMDLVTELVTAFLESANAHLARVKRAVAEDDAKVLAQVAHSMKSSAAMLGAGSLADGYRQLEKCAREGRVDDARARLDQVERDQLRALQSLRELTVEVQS